MSTPSRIRRERTLVLRFAIVSLVAFVAVGAALRFFVGRDIRDREQHQAAFRTVFMARAVLPSVLRPSDLRAPVDDERWTELREALVPRLFVGGIIRLKVWRPDGTVVFADEHRLVGRRFVDEAEELQEILETGTPKSQISDLTAEENVFERGLADRTFATYVPLPLPGQHHPMAVAELYQDYAPTALATARFQRDLDVVLVGGLILLYALILPLAHRTGRALRRQASTLEEQAGRLATLLAREQDSVYRLRELNRMKSDFISTASHELRTPLTAILGFAKTLQQPEHAEDRRLRDEFLSRMEKQGERLLGLIEQLLSTARLERGRVEVRLVPFDLRRLAGDVADAVDGGSAHVALDIPHDLPAVVSDQGLVGQILTNLLENAVKYTPNGAAATMGARLEGHTLRLWVQDRGLGMSEEQVRYAFQPFYQVEGGLTRTSSGVGLGLYLVRLIVEALGGEVGVESAPGKGSRFTVTLPTGRSAPAGEERETLSPAASVRPAASLSEAERDRAAPSDLPGTPGTGRGR